MRILYGILCFFCFFTSSYSDVKSHLLRNDMVASEHRLATQVGVDILRAGGNAVDAAVAVGYALAVVNPCCGNLGGGGFMTIHLANGQNITLNFREKAPLKASRDMYLDTKKNVRDEATTNGYLSVGVPGTVLGLDTALKQYGTMTRQQVMEQAIRLARKGYLVTPYEAQQFQKFSRDFRAQPNVANIFLKNGHSYKAGERFIQTDLAETLTLIQEKGAEVFYKGSIAHDIVTASQAHGGILTLKDFADYSIEEKPPIHCNYHGYTLLVPPLPSGGETLCHMLAKLQKSSSLHPPKYRSAQSVTDVIEAMQYGFVKRNHIDLKKKMTTYDHELTDTTHYSVVDKNGNAVAVTYTLNGFFGARVIAGHTGFFLNDSMDDFTAKVGVANKFGLVQSEKNAISPGKRPLSSMTPTIVLKNGRVFMVIGSPGGPRIITSILLSFINVIDYNKTLQDAINAPRYHYQVIPDYIEVEPGVFSSAVKKELLKRGYHLLPQRTWGAVEAIQSDPATGKWLGANDYRRPDGGALGNN